MGGQFAIKDDKNPAWEDIEYESDDDAEYEKMWRNDEKVNNEREVKGEDTKDLKSAGIHVYRQFLEVRLLLISTRISITLTVIRKISRLSLRLGSRHGVKAVILSSINRLI
jgi:hypothetical protein